MTVKIDRSGCISCGLCVETCPDVFKFEEDGLAQVIRDPQPEEESIVAEAAENCPVTVIHTEE